MRKAEANLELNLARDVKYNKKGLFKYIHSKRKTRENVGLLLNEAGALVMEDTEKAELLNAAFASVFTAEANPQESQTLEDNAVLSSYYRNIHEKKISIRKWCIFASPFFFIYLAISSLV
ncbi:rna-directed dna polymerase from mobile element jockey-like [Limosa lapponica baueri]|uniref:Rna-directed dna polymerase from mobile element jockey-like n=1 Tax=Limosa lapponica baueri TaxID=1758121 RepID=A0A2I0UP27_LIMLA|nr:rna-directed dna polymerase from mobile element jockey-like [Limosa lapponica baueri]